jgi:hypothetical protein
LHPRVSPRAMTERKTPTPPPSKPLLHGYRALYDVPPKARFARTAVNSTALYAIPLHVSRIVRHTCKLPSFLAYKRRGSPLAAGGRRTDSTHLYTFRLHRDIGTRLNQTSGIWRLLLLSRLACSAPLQANGATQYSASSTPLLDVRPPAGTRINIVSPSCLAPAIER